MVQRTEQRMLREMVAGRRRREDDYKTWVQRCAWAIRRARQKWKLKSWSRHWLERHWTWLAHLHRSSHQSPAKDALEWKSRWRWRTLQASAQNSNHMLPEEGAHPSRGGWHKSLELECQEFCERRYSENQCWRWVCEDRQWWSDKKSHFATELLQRWRLT